MDEKQKEYIRKCREWIARRKARVDQKQKQFEDQYGIVWARENEMRFQDLEAWKFEIEVNEWELEQTIKGWLEDETES